MQEIQKKYTRGRSKPLGGARRIVSANASSVGSIGDNSSRRNQSEQLEVSRIVTTYSQAGAINQSEQKILNQQEFLSAEGLAKFNH